MAGHIGKFRYRLALDPRLLARIVSESETAEEKLRAISKWAKYANRRLAQLKQAPVYRVVVLEDGTEGVFAEDNSIQTDYGPALKPICGAENARDGLRCNRPRGLGTFHPGYGRCLDCEKKVESAIYRTGSIYKPGNELMIELNRANQMPARLVECLTVSENLEQKVLQDVVPDLKTIYGLVQFILEGGLHHVTAEDREAGTWHLGDTDIRLVHSLLKGAVEAKKIRFLMEKQQTMDPQTVKAFVGQVMSVVFSHVDAGTARKIGGEILDNVIRPFRTDGRIGGEEGDYHDIGKGMTKAVASYAGVQAQEVQFPKGERMNPEELQRVAEEGYQKVKKFRVNYERSTGTRLEDAPLRELRDKERRRERREARAARRGK